jgi:hypothetical protein
MALWSRTVLGIGFSVIVSAAGVHAQDINLGAGGADLVWHGQESQARAGAWLDQGALDSGDPRRDLIVGVPGTASVGGKVYVLFGGPTRTGQLSLAQAEAVFSGTGPGDLFGTATAAGNVIDLPSEARRSLIVGAPGAAGGRGVVYLFAGGFSRGTDRTPADAVLSVTGGIGDRLGSSLATADLDGDGFREIIMGAPGTGRVYILYGGRDLTGARTPDVTIEGGGIGAAVAAGDITADGRYDVMISTPLYSLVYVIKGRASGRLSATMAVPRDEDLYFFGSPGDEAGTSLFVGDINGDNTTDLFVGAPNGGASQAGAVYVLLGSAQRATSSLAQAELTLYGPAAGARMGRVVTTGDMNRDGRDDLAMLTDGGPGGVGEVLVFYGRSGSLGAPGPSGFPVVDMGVASNVSRRILGDANGTLIRSCIIFEVTGEGARDVIVGAPDGASDAGAQSGRVYFSNSPRMSVPSSPVYLAAVQGGTGTASIQVRNQSTVWITWSARPRAAWQSLSPATGSSIGTDPGSFVVTGSGAGLAPGQYEANVTVTSTSPDLEMFRNVPVTMAVYSPPTLTANRSFPAQVGTPITWTANAHAGGLGLQYAFYRYDPGTGWRPVQAYSASNTYTWTPTQSDVGEHYVQVWIRSTLSSASYDVYAGTAAFSIVTPSPTMASFTADVMSPAPLGSTINLTATATGGIAPLQYQFYAFKEGQGWTLLRAYGSANTFAWTPASTGLYSLQVWVRNAGSTATYQAWAGMQIEVSTTAPLKVHALTADRPLPLKVGTTVTWTAAASGGSAGPLQYQFWRYHAGSGTWTMVRGYNTSPQYVWTIAPGDEGDYALQVWVRSAGSSASFEAYAGTTMFSVQRDPVVVDSLTADRTFPVTPGTTVTWSASARGGANLQYRFYVYNASTGWTMIRDYASGATAQWVPAQAGTYSVQVWVRSADSTATYDAWKGVASVLVQAPD